MKYKMEEGKRRPKTALEPNPGYPIPNAMFTIEWETNEYMFAHYMEVAEVAGHDHHIYASCIAKYDSSDRVFRPYKPDVYRWTGTGAPWVHFHFGMASFWIDYNSGFVYTIGSPSGRFGGVKLARIPINSFVDSEDSRGWEYYLGDSQWSDPTFDENVINSAVWLIQPKDPEWSLSKNYDELPWNEQCQLITIAEFNVIYNPYLEKFVLITGRPCPATLGGGVWYYTAPEIWGPWCEENLLMENKLDGGNEWTCYGTYTTDAFLNDNGKIMYFVATTWDTYGIYLYKAEFTKGDFNNDGKVNLLDFAMFAGHWLDTDCGVCGGADFTSDGEVGLDDLREFVANWLAGVE